MFTDADIGRGIGFDRVYVYAMTICRSKFYIQAYQHAWMEYQSCASVY